METIKSKLFELSFVLAEGLAWNALTKPEMGAAEHLSLTFQPFKVFHAFYPHRTSENLI